MAYKKVITVVVHTSCSSDNTFADGANGNYGTIALYQIRNGMDVDTVGSAAGVPATEIFIPYHAITYAEISADIEEIEIPADEACVIEGACDASLEFLSAEGPAEGYPVLTPEYSADVKNYELLISAPFVVLDLDPSDSVTMTSDAATQPSYDSEEHIWNCPVNTTGDAVTNINIAVSNGTCTTNYKIVATYHEHQG